jgi:hypothetical protein
MWYNPSNGRVYFEASTVVASKIQLQGIDWIVSFSSDKEL